MSLFDWLIPKSRPHKHAATATLAKESARQVTNGHENGHAATPDSGLKMQRQERRDRLYAVVREAMLRSEVLASRYKFKVLSLDSHGQEFLVMVDLLDAKAVSPRRFPVIEQLIISHALQQHEMCVKSVYWRVNEVAAEQSPEPAARASVPHVPVAVVPVAATPAALPSSSHPPSSPVHTPVFEPIDQAEVMAFKKALGAMPGADASGAGQIRTSGPRHHSAETGYEDTQLLAQPDEVASPLSRTQFGDL